jgi:hypothetical protein
VDSEDAELVMRYRWHLGSNGYARHNIKRAPLLMHRLILGLDDPSLCGDHINGNRTDNRRSNLRVVTRAENAQNRRRLKPSGRTFRNVEPHHGAWRVRITIGGEKVTVGTFATEQDAAIAAEQYRLGHMRFAEPDPAAASLLAAA